MARLTLFAFAVMVAGMALAVAAPIPGLTSTGTASPGSLDPNWLWAPSSGGTFINPYVTQTDSSGFPFYAWVANDSTSRWISPNVGYGNDTGVWGDNPGLYTFRLFFNIPANAVLGTGTFTYQIATDNNLHSIWLNGHMLPYIPASLSAMSAPSTVGPGAGLFLAGMNVLDIIVDNIGSVANQNQGSWNPVGLRVAFLSSYIEIPEPPGGEIPEPGTMLLMAAGLCAVGLLKIRSSSKV